MSKDLIKKHSISITVGVISNAVFMGLLNGIPVLIAWITAHVASVRGLALHWVILLCVTVFVLMALGLNLISMFIIRRRKHNPEFWEPHGVSSQAVQCPEKWLHTIADDQAQTIYRWVCVTDCQYYKHELMRDDPYVEFVFYIHNRSVYDVRFDTLRGPIYFAGRQLSGQLKWSEKPNEITYGNIGSIIIQQGLSKDDVIHILNAPTDIGRFDFRRLEIPAKDREDRIVSQPLQIQQWELSNDLFLKVHPKLEIEIKKIELKPTNLDLKKASSLINVKISFVSRRSERIAVQGFKLRVQAGGETYVKSAESGTIYTIWQTNSEGEKLYGDIIENLYTGSIIYLEQGEKREGWLQFTIHNIIPLQLEDTEAVLAIVDTSGEEHRIECLLQDHNSLFQREVRRRF
jgi:hypothetical protein